MADMITQTHGRRSLWDRRDTSRPSQYIDWGTLSRMSPNIWRSVFGNGRF